MGTLTCFAPVDKHGREEFDLRAEIDARIPAPAGRCHACTKHLRSKDDPTVQYAAGLPCWSWRCLVCGPNKVRRLMEKFADKLLYGDGVPFVLNYQRAKWVALGKKLSRVKGHDRNGCDGLRVETDAEGNGTIAGLAPVPVDGMVPLVDPVTAVVRLLDAMALMYAQLAAGRLAPKGKSGRLQPLAGIGGWKLKAEKSGASTHEVVGDLPREFMDPERLKAHLKAKGIDSEEKTNVGRSNWIVRWRSPDNPFATEVSESCSLVAVLREQDSDKASNPRRRYATGLVPVASGAAGGGHSQERQGRGSMLTC